ncbi:MAG TPA: PIN domain-containing protein [Acidothermaceae bacterium]
MTIKKRAPSGVVDVLRLLVVVFFAGLGYEVSKRFSSGAFALGPLNGVMVGIIIGSGLGYVLGGVLGRTTVTAVGRTEHTLRQTSAEELVAGSFGGVIGVLVGAGVAWWIFLLLQPFLAFPLFGFVVLVIGYLGYRLGSNRREEMLSMFAGRAGMGPRHQSTSNLPRVVDTSVAIDGRILDVVRAGFLDGTFLVSSPVLAELQGLADAGDDLRRSKGRRGLQNLEALKREPGVNLEVLDEDLPAVPEVDAKLVRICLDRGVPLLTLDTNLAKAASLAGVHVMNLHGLALALRPPVSAGDDVIVHLLRPGKEAGQAVGYLDDGTMVVAERSRDHIGDEIAIHVTSVLTTANGRMVFGQPVATSQGPNGTTSAPHDGDPLRVEAARPGPPSHPLGRAL